MFVPFSFAVLSETDRRAAPTGTKMTKKKKTVQNYFCLEIQSQMFDHISEFTPIFSLLSFFICRIFFRMHFENYWKIINHLLGSRRKWMEHWKVWNEWNHGNSTRRCLSYPIHAAAELNSSDRKRQRSSISARRVPRTAERIENPEGNILWLVSVRNFSSSNFGQLYVYIARLTANETNNIEENKIKRGILNVCQGKSVVVCRYSVVCLCSFGGQPSQIERSCVHK